MITTLDNHLIHYEVLGRGKPLIFIHGWLGSWRYWWPSMQALSSRHRSFAFDLWGYGDSSKAPDKYTLVAYVEMVDRFIDQLGIMKPITLIGHSLGAAVALRYTLDNPQTVEKLVTVALPVQGNYIDRRLIDSDPDSFIAKAIGKSNSFTEIDTEIRKTDKAAVNQSADELISSPNLNIASDLTNTTRPILMIFGNEDPVVQPPSGDFHHLQRSSSNRFYVGLDDCSHFPMLQEKAKFNRLILDFMNADSDGNVQIAEKEFWQRRTR